MTLGKVSTKRMLVSLKSPGSPKPSKEVKFIDLVQGHIISWSRWDKDSTGALIKMAVCLSFELMLDLMNKLLILANDEKALYSDEYVSVDVRQSKLAMIESKKQSFIARLMVHLIIFFFGSD